VKSSDKHIINAKKVIHFLVSASIVCCLLAIYLLQYTQKLNLRKTFLLNLSFMTILVIFLLIMSFGTIWPKRLLENKQHWILFLMVVAIGIFARTFQWNIFPVPDGQFSEEAQTGGVASFTLRGSGIDIYFPIVNLLAETGLKTFGFSMNGLRIPFLVWGILSVPIFFVAARLLFQSFFAAVFSSVLFASCAFLAGSSRIAMETMSPITTQTIALAATFYACTRKNYVSFCIAGFAIGGLLTEYVGFKLIAGMMIVFLVASFFQDHDCVYARPSKPLYHINYILPYYKHFLVLFGCMLIVLMPFILSGITTLSQAFFENILRNKAAISSISRQQMSWWSMFVQQLVKVKNMASFVFIKGENNDIVPYTQGIIEFFTGMIGLIIGLYCLPFLKKSPAKMFVVGTIVFTVFGAGFFVYNPSRGRLIPIMPLYFLLIGIGVDDTLKAIRKYQRIVIVWFSVVLAILVGLNFYCFFGVAIHQEAVQQMFYDVNVILAQHIASIQKHDQQAMIYLLSDKDFLGVDNDYGFLYHKDKVRVVKSFDDLKGKTGYLITHDQFLATVKDMEHLSQCNRWHTKYDRNEVMCCQMK
jgi:hypothetical protein